MEFLEPADVSGTRFLTIGDKAGDDDQRLYLPSLGKIRKIASSGKDGSFMGSELSYYDLEERSFGDGVYRLVREVVENGVTYSIIESVPADKNAPYSRTEMKVSHADWFVYQIDCYEKKNPQILLKKIVFVEVRLLDGVIVPVKIAVENLISKRKTLLQWNDTRVNAPVDAKLFTVQNLER